MKKDQINTLVQVLTIIPIVLISLGALKLVSFYKCFNINIGQYLKLQDILMLFLVDIYFYLNFFLFPFLYSFLVFKNKEMQNLFTDKINHPELYSEVDVFLRKPSTQKSIALIILIALFIASITIVIAMDIYNELLLFLIAIIILLLVEIIYVGKKSMKIYLFPLYAVCFLFVFYFNINLEIRSVNKFKYFGTEIITDKVVYVSDSTINYIGKTLDYYFLHNVKDNSNIIIPVDQVSKLVLKDTNYNKK